MRVGTLEPEFRRVVSLLCDLAWSSVRKVTVAQQLISPSQDLELGINGPDLRSYQDRKEGAYLQNALAWVTAESTLLYHTSLLGILPEPGAGDTISPLTLAPSLERKFSLTPPAVRWGHDGEPCVRLSGQGGNFQERPQQDRSRGCMEVNRLEQRGSSWVGEKSTSGCMSQLQQGLVTEPEAGWGSRNKAAYETGWDQGAMIDVSLCRPLWVQRTLCQHHPF